LFTEKTSPQGIFLFSVATEHDLCPLQLFIAIARCSLLASAQQSLGRGQQLLMAPKHLESASRIVSSCIDVPCGQLRFSSLPTHACATISSAAEITSHVNSHIDTNSPSKPEKSTTLTRIPTLQDLDNAFFKLMDRKIIRPVMIFKLFYSVFYLKFSVGLYSILYSCILNMSIVLDISVLSTCLRCFIVL